ncbi:MAG: protein kinase [Verrucomicrobia bacterium]|nr:protein kinase [Verrucomicrobiota bacterium]
MRITDFGIAAFTGQIQGKEVRAGTPSHMAPEQLAGTEVTVRSDLYSLGLVLYELFTGKKAIDGTSLTQIERAHQRGTPPTPANHVRDLDPQVERIILRCLEPDPKNRPRSAMAVAAALPGTNLIAEAIAAGDTPSPELLAEAGESGALRPWVAIACWIGVVAALAGAFVIKDRTSLLRFIPALKPPEVLAERAEQIIQRLAYTNAPADKAFWFREEYGPLSYLTNLPAAVDRLKQLASGKPAPVVFRYRSSPREMKPVEAPFDIHSRVSDSQPSFTEPGMRRATLDPQGRLLGFSIVPGRSHAPGDSSKEADWSVPFAEAELAMTNFTPVAVNRTPEFYCDRVAAWTGAYPGWPGQTLRVEAGSVAGKPVFFSLIGPWRGAPVETPSRSNADRPLLIDRVVWIGFLSMIVLVVAAAFYLARRNLLTGRGDRIGARRLGLFVFALGMGEFLCRAHSPGYHSVFSSLVIQMGAGFGAWILYLSIEPYARRYWPHTVVSWSRLWSGRWRDPSVGRDVLIGCLAGLAWLLLLQAVEFAPKSWTGRDPSDPYLTGNLDLFLGGRHVVGHILGNYGLGLAGFSLIYFLFFLLVRILVRRDWIMYWVSLAGHGAFYSAALIYSEPPASWLHWIALLTLAAILAIVPVRFGLLAFVAMRVSFYGLSSSLPFDSSAWWAGTALIDPMLVFALATYGCWVAMAGKRLFKEEVLA